MKATLIGHACWLIETDAGPILTDPVFGDRFEDGTVTPCPSRIVRVDALPSLRAIFLSHRHLDHFDLPSLRLLDRHLPVFCPSDPLLLRGLEALGFRDIRQLQAFHPVHFDGLELFPTPSVSSSFIELGVVLRDCTGALFNQVDTPLSNATLEQLHALGPLDVHFAMYACQAFGLFEAKRHDLAAEYGRNLATALAVGARCIVPAAAGFRFADDFGWLNPHLFPISEQRFAADLRRLAPDPGVRIEEVLPGDRLEIDREQIIVHRNNSPFVELRADDRFLLEHQPSAQVPELFDRNIDGYHPVFLERVVEGLLDALRAFVEAATRAGSDPVVGAYVDHRATYELRVVFPAPAEERGWRFHFDASEGVTVTDPTAGPEPDVRRQIAASALAGQFFAGRSCFFARVQSRRSSNVLDPTIVDDRVRVRRVELRDLLSHFVRLSKISRQGEVDGLLSYYGMLPGEP